MTNFPIIDLIAGMIFVYFLLAIINNSLFEIVASVLKLRSFSLRKWLESTFDQTYTDTSTQKQDTLAHSIMNHPLLKGRTKPDKSTTYMDGKIFALTLMEILSRNNAKNLVPDSIENVRQSIEETTLLSPEIKNSLLLFCGKAANAVSADKITLLEKHIAEWFDSSMQRLGSRFKRHALYFTMGFATIITVSLNIDSISLVNYLYNNPEARQKLAASAYQAAQDTTYITRMQEFKKSVKQDTVTANDSLQHTADSIIAEIKKHKQEMDTAMATLSSVVPIGWSEDDCTKWSESTSFKLKKCGGFLITILAICLGAPFWFDILSKVANIRSSLKPSSVEEREKTEKKK